MPCAFKIGMNFEYFLLVECERRCWNRAIFGGK